MDNESSKTSPVTKYVLVFFLVGMLPLALRAIYLNYVQTYPDSGLAQFSSNHTVSNVLSYLISIASIVGPVVFFSGIFLYLALRKKTTYAMYGGLAGAFPKLAILLSLLGPYYAYKNLFSNTFVESSVTIKIISIITVLLVSVGVLVKSRIFYKNSEDVSQKWLFWMEIYLVGFSIVALFTIFI